MRQYIVHCRNQEQTKEVLDSYPEIKFHRSFWEYVIVGGSYKKEVVFFQTLGGAKKLYPTLKVISFEQWKNLLPENWWIRGGKELAEYFTQIGVSQYSSNFNYKLSNNGRGGLTGSYTDHSYYINSSGLWDVRVSDNSSNKNEITLEQYKKSFVDLPEKWYVKYNSRYEWDKLSLYIPMEGYTYIPQSNPPKYAIGLNSEENKTTWINGQDDENYHKQHGFEEITFERFLQTYLNRNMKKIIGYKAPTDLWGGQVKKDSLYTRDNEINYSYRNSANFRIPNEVVETWEPVYEDEEIKRMFGRKEIVIYPGEKIIVTGLGDVSLDKMISINEYIKNPPSLFGYKLRTSDDKLVFGCVEGTINEFNEIYKILISKKS